MNKPDQDYLNEYAKLTLESVFNGNTVVNNIEVEFEEYEKQLPDDDCKFYGRTGKITVKITWFNPNHAT